ncbi:FecCD family ABC transporter permease [Intestinibacter sp.]|uniref:FecCD family ABC transporter permease n=1 Tax=Intestinibacter sp. TaxID=1965304 RepID=UPI003F182E1E
MKKVNKILILFITTLVLFVATICIGRVRIPLDIVAKCLYKGIFNGNVEVPYDTYVIIMSIRLPRACLAVLVGSSLAIAGAAFQALFHNPLVSSGILGISSGAGFGAALSIVLFSGTIFTPVFAFTFGVLAVALSYFVGRVYKNTTAITLVLGGTVISNIFSALLQLVKYTADPYNELPAITFWLMGSLSSTVSKDIILYSIPMVVGTIGLCLLGWNLNVLSMGDKEAKSLGINVTLNKILVIVFATMTTAGAVCVSGSVGWVGLVIPHISRMIIGTDNRVLMPTTILLGSSFLLIVDTICRTLTGAELPLGIITSLFGGPFFIYLLKKTKGANWQ